MKILMWSTYSYPSIGGLEVMVQNLATQLIQEGHQVIILANNTQSSEYCKLMIDQIPIHHLPFNVALIKKNLPLIKEIFAHLSSLLENFSPDVIHIHGWYEYMAFYQTRALIKKNAPILLTIHGLLDQPTYQTTACSLLFNMCSAINLVSKSLIKEMQNMTTPKQLPFHLIYNGLPSSSLEIKNIQQQPAKLLMVGRLSKEKGFATAFHAMGQLTAKYPKLRLTLLGNGDQAKYLHALRTGLKLEQVIEMPGWVEPKHVVHYIDNATLVIVPSSYESFGLVALEAAMRARPVIASNVGGLPEVIQHNKTGILIEPENPSALAAAIDRLLSHPKKILAMADRARKTAVQLFSLKASTQQYLAIYQNILEVPHD